MAVPQGYVTFDEFARLIGKGKATIRGYIHSSLDHKYLGKYRKFFDANVKHIEQGSFRYFKKPTPDQLTKIKNFLAFPFARKLTKATDTLEEQMQKYSQRYRTKLRTEKIARGETILTPSLLAEKNFQQLLNNEKLKAAMLKDFDAGLTLEEIRVKYRAGGAGASLMPSNISKMGKYTVQNLLGEWGRDASPTRAIEARKVDVTSKEAKEFAKKIKKFYGDPKLSRKAAQTKLGGVTKSVIDKFIERWNEKNPNNLIDIKRAYGERGEGAKFETKTWLRTTERLQKFQDFLKNNSDKTYRVGTVELAKLVKKSGYSPIGFSGTLAKLRRIYKGEGRPGFKINEQVKSVINTKFPQSTALTRDLLLAAGYPLSQIQKIARAQDVLTRGLTKPENFLNQLEHKVPKSIARELLNNKLISSSQYKDIVGRITPVTSYLNQWKTTFDMQRLYNLNRYLASEMSATDIKDFNKIENSIVREAKRISGGYNIGKVSLSADGVFDLKSPDELFKSKVKGIGSGSRALIEFSKNIEYHNNIVNAYIKNPKAVVSFLTPGGDVINESAFKGLKSFLDKRGETRAPVFDDTVTKQISKLSSADQFSKYFSKNVDNPLLRRLVRQSKPGLGYKQYEELLSAIEKSPQVCRKILNYQTGGISQTCAVAVQKDPVGSAKKLANLEATSGPVATVKNAAKGFLGALGKWGPKVGKYGAIMAAGAVAQPLVKQFMNDDPSTYLTDEEQMKGMLLSTIDAQERKKPRSEILDWGMGAGQLGATAAAVPGSGALYKYRRGLSEAKIPKAGPIAESGLTAGDYLSKHAGKDYGKLRAGAGVGMKLLSGMFTPAGLLATEPLRIAQKRREGESWGDIATSPMTWMGPAFAPGMAKIATSGMKKGALLARALRLGIPMATLNAWNPVGWTIFAASLGLEGYSQYKDYKKKRGFFASDED